MAVAPLAVQEMSPQLTTTTVENELKQMLASGHTPADLIITYDDMHGLWGGSLLTVRGDGWLERKILSRGATTPTASRKRVGEHEVLELVRLLVELSAWEQRTPESPPVPDESRPQLTIQVNGVRCQVWERSTEMRTNKRLLQVESWIQHQFQ